MKKVETKNSVIARSVSRDEAIHLSGAARWIASLTLAMTLCGNAHATDWQYPQAVASVSPTGIDITPQRTSVAVTVSAPAPYFTVSADDVASAVAASMKSQGVSDKDVKATLLPGSPSLLYSADHALTVTIQALQIDKNAHRWQGQAYIMSNGKTETVKPVAGFYEAMISVPVLVHQVGSTDVIAQSDIEMKSFSEKQIRKDTVTDATQLIGKAPHRTISAERPIRVEEIAMPLAVKKGQSVEMTYTTPYVHIRDQAEALEDGAVGATIRVKNTKSGKAVSSRVVDTGHVEANLGEM